MKTKDKKIKAGLTMEIDIKNLASLVLQEIKRHEEEEFFNFREAAKFLDYNEKYFYRAIKKRYHIIARKISCILKRKN